MKYTRYDLRKKKSDNIIFVIIICMVLLLAFIIGNILSRLFFRKSNPNIKDINQPKISEEKSTENEKKAIKLIIIQCGIYDSKENVEEQKKLLSAYGVPFVIEENSKYKVFMGIYDEDSAAQVVKLLSDKKIDNSQNVYIINVNDLCDAEIVGIINGYIQIMSKLSEKSVRAVQTDEFKKWINSLKEINSESKNASVFQELKSYIQLMPKEITKDKAQENYIFIYGVIKKVSVSVSTSNQ